MYEQEIVLRRIQREVYALLSEDDYKGWQEADWKGLTGKFLDNRQTHFEALEVISE